MRSLSVFVISAAAIITSMPCFAQQSADQPCEGAQSQNEMTRCWVDAARKVEASIAERTARLGKLTVGSNALPAALLKKEQDAWIAYSNAYCGLFEARYQGASAQTMNVAVCRYRVGMQRGADLDVLLEELSR